MDMNTMTLPRKDLKTRPYSMDKKDLKKLTKGQSIKLLMSNGPKPMPQIRAPIPVPKPRTNKPMPQIRAPIPVPKPRTPQIRALIPKPMTDKPIPQIRADRPVPKPMVKLEGLKRAPKGHAMSSKVSIANSKEIVIHLKVSEPVIVSHLENLLGSMNGYKFIRTLKLTFMKGQIDSDTGERYFIYRETLMVRLRL